MDPEAEGSTADASDVEDSGSDSAKEDENAPVSILKFGKGRRRRGRRPSIRWSIGSPQKNEAAARGNVPVVSAAAAPTPTPQGPLQTSAAHPHGASAQQATPITPAAAQAGTVSQVPAPRTVPPASAPEHPPAAAPRAPQPQGTLATRSSAAPPPLPTTAAGLAPQQAPPVPPRGTVSNVDRPPAVPAVSYPAQMLPAVAPMPAVAPATPAVGNPAQMLPEVSPGPAVSPVSPFYNNVIPAPNNVAFNSRAQPVPSVQSLLVEAGARCPTGFPLGAMLLLTLAVVTVGLLTFFVLFTEVWSMETDTVDWSAKLTALTDFKVPSTNERTSRQFTTPEKTPGSDGSGIRRAGEDWTEGDEQNGFSSVVPDTSASEPPMPL